MRSNSQGAKAADGAIELQRMGRAKPGQRANQFVKLRSLPLRANQAKADRQDGLEVPVKLDRADKVSNAAVLQSLPMRQPWE